MKKVIDIVAFDAASHGADAQTPKIAKADLAAAIDLDIYEADDIGLDGERFWEAFWRTQHVYGGVVEGQPLDVLFRSLDDAIIDKMHDDITRLGDNLVTDDGEKNYILGMVIFLLCIEKADPQYDPIGEQGYEASLAYFASLVDAEYRRRNRQPA